MAGSIPPDVSRRTSSSSPESRPGPKGDRDRGRGPSDRARWALLTSLGIMFPVSITLGAAIGYFIDRELGTLPWFSAVFLVLGIIAAFVNLFRTLAKFEKLDSEAHDEATESTEKTESTETTETGPH